jgi:hypothetical protein
VELKAKLDNFFANNITAPLGIIATMPPCVLAKFVEHIIFHLHQSGVPCSRHFCCNGEHCFAVFDQDV